MPLLGLRKRVVSTPAADFRWRGSVPNRIVAMKDGADADDGALKQRIKECSNCCLRPFSLYRLNPPRRNPMMRKDNGRRVSWRPSSRRRLLRRQRERNSPATSARSISKNVSERSRLRRERALNSRGVKNRPSLDAARPASRRGSRIASLFCPGGEGRHEPESRPRGPDSARRRRRTGVTTAAIAVEFAERLAPG